MTDCSLLSSATGHLQAICTFRIYLLYMFLQGKPCNNCSFVFRLFDLAKCKIHPCWKLYQKSEITFSLRLTNMSSHTHTHILFIHSFVGGHLLFVSITIFFRWPILTAHILSQLRTLHLLTNPLCLVIHYFHGNPPRSISQPVGKSTELH